MIRSIRKPLAGLSLAVLAGAIPLTVAGAAQAGQTSCPPNGPEVAFYSVSSATDPDRTFESAFREASIIGGDVVQGRVRIFMRFAEPLSSSCTGEIYLWRHPSATTFGTPGQNNQDPRAYFQDLFPQRVAERLDFAGDGDDTALVVIPTNPYVTTSPRQRSHNVWFSIGRFGVRHPFTVIQRSSTLDFRAAAASTVGRAPVQLTATSSIQLHPDADLPIGLSIAPRTAGNFVVGSRLLPETTIRPDPGISPSRVNINFMAASAATPTLVTIVASTGIAPVFAGGDAAQERPISITVEPEPQPCKVEADVTARSGGLDVVVLNTGTVLCSNLTILTAMSEGTTRDTIASVAPGREVRLRRPLGTTPPASALPRSPIAPVTPVVPLRPIAPLSRTMAPRDYGRVSVYLEMKSGPPMLIGGRELTPADTALIDGR
jgi:hypothetical protein